MVLTFSFILFILCFTDYTSFVFSGPHAHDLGKEKVEHGAYSPRDSQHYRDGQHHSEFDHEAVLGSHSAAEEFDHLTPDEAKKRLGDIALKMDNDMDGHVNKEELTQWVLRSFRLLTEEESKERLEEEDVNEDGKVNWQEHYQETFGIGDDEENDIPASHYADEKRMIEEDKELFEVADLNGDGQLDEREYAGFSHPEEFEHMHKILYQQTMRKKDADGDGMLSLSEFLKGDNGKAVDQNSEYYAIEMDKFEQDYDKNRDGKLDPSEVLSWLVPDNREMAETEAEHLIESSDDNQDGLLSISEIVDHHDVFVGSEVTDFGEHLQYTHKFNDEL